MKILLVGGDRRQTVLAGLLRSLGETDTLRVPELPDRAENRPYDLLILPCPCLDGFGRLRTAGEGLDPACLDDWIGEHTRVFGGALGLLRERLPPCAGVTDLLEDPRVATANGRLTAEAALLLTMGETGRSLRGADCAVLGYGRIGKPLAWLLRSFGAAVRVAVRRPEVLAEAEALGFSVCTLPALEGTPELVFNTIPAQVLPEARLASLGPDCLWVELASRPGGLPEPAPSGLRVLPAGGLPGKLLPVSAAQVLAQGIFRAVRREA